MAIMHRKYLGSVALAACLLISLQHCSSDLSLVHEEPAQCEPYDTVHVERQSLAQITSALKNGDPHTRLAAVTSLVASLGLGYDSIFTRDVAASSASITACKVDGALAFSRAALENKPSRKRLRGYDTVQCGSLQDVLGIIATALDDVNPIVRQTAAKAFVALLENEVSPQDVLPLIQKAFEDEDPSVLQIAREALGVMVGKVDTEQDIDIDKLLRIDRYLLQAIEEDRLSQVQAIIGDHLTRKPVYQPKFLLHLALREAGEEKIIIIAQYIVRQAKCAMKRLPEHDLIDLYRHSLETAIVFEAPEILKVLLEGLPQHIYQKPDEEDGSTLLHFAACVGAIPCVKLLVEEKQLSVIVKDKEGGLPLHYAATKGNVECMLYLIEQMQGIGRQDLLDATGGKFGFTPLHCLVYSEEIEEDEANLERVVSALESNKSLKDCRERTPRDLALSMSEVAIDIDLL